MKILFHTDTLCYRGGTVAVLDYAKGAKNLLGHEVIISYHEDWKYRHDFGTEEDVKVSIEKNYELRGVRDGNYDKVCHDVDFAYFIRAGWQDGLPTNTKSGVHAMFQRYEPHGNVYAYISEWLSYHMTGGSIPWVPHIVDLPKPNQNIRSHFGIPNTATVIGRLGGYNSFDVPFAADAVKLILDLRSDYYFLFVNTRPFYIHPRLIYLNPIIDLQLKSNFICSCDAFIHARLSGESFGLALCESLFHNKPTLSWNGGWDMNHTKILKNTPLLFDKSDILDKLLSVKELSGEWSKLVLEFSPQAVMNKFDSVFLSSP